ncbi:methyltransferase domain-containing protein [Amycolatopsis jejuensis]|uniref:methyltransferase domain-containing protein n=1 Tax=Amycolatopsis jejuensis TaxID=330084 RepID=UPI00068F10A3|nr:methyltransferase domain-containing protein [Amycolatopsis jejuensis]
MSTTADRAAFAHPLFTPGMTIVDLGCGRSPITAPPNARVIGVDLNPAPSTVDHVTATAYALPFATASIDAVFSHALFEHLENPLAALTEIHRVLRPGGHLALSTSDWSRAKLTPKTPNATAALRGHYLLHRRQGGDPFYGRTAPTHVAAAGFTNIATRTKYREDHTYKNLATHIKNALAAALTNPPATDHDQLTSAARSAWSWHKSATTGDFAQCWQELTATRP